MKNTQQCPKCQSKEILHISGQDNENYIKTGTFKSVLVTRYLCADCGYSEEWIDDKEQLEKIKKKYQGK